jgi:hypothetical protein
MVYSQNETLFIITNVLYYITLGYRLVITCHDKDLV